MAAIRRLVVSVFDKQMKFQGWVSNPVYLTVTERWHGLGSGEIEVEANDPVVSKLLEPGARIRVNFGYATEFESLVGVQVFSGMVRTPTGAILANGNVRVQLQDDWRWLRNVRAFVVPEGTVKPLTTSDHAQSWLAAGETPLAGTVRGLVGRYEWPSTPTVFSAEAAVVEFLRAHLRDRWFREFGSWDAGVQDYRFQIFSDGDRGPDVRSILPQVRFHTLEDIVVPLLEAGNLGLRFVSSGTTTVKGLSTVQMWEAKAWPHILTPDSGAISDGSWEQKYPEGTHAIVGGPGEEAARAFRVVEDETGRAEDFGDLIDVFRDATGAPVYWPETITDDEQKVAMYYHLIAAVPADRRAEFETFLISAGADALADTAPTSGVSIELQEAGAFRYAGYDNQIGAVGFNTGDLVTVSPSAETVTAGLTFTDRITETTFTLTRAEGVTVRPQLGQKKEDTTRQLAAAINMLARSSVRQSINK